MRSAIAVAALLVAAALWTPAPANAAPSPQSGNSGNSGQMPVGMGRKKPPQDPQQEPSQDQSQEQNKSGEAEKQPPKKKGDERR